MKKRYLIMVGLAAMVLGSTVSALVKHERANRPLIDRFVRRLTWHLDLSDAQQTKVRSILEAERATLGPLFEEAARNRQQVREATASGNFDEARVRSLAARQAQSMAEIIVERERVKARIYSEVLTAEQRTKADQLLRRWDMRSYGRFYQGTEGLETAGP